MSTQTHDTHDTTLETDERDHVTEDGACHVGGEYGRYRLERKIGVGGMGEVFAARHLDTGELVAFKTLARAHATQRYRFKREFRSLADVEHPNLVRLSELVVPASGPSFFTMELLDGTAFTTWVRGDAEPGQLPDLARLEAALRQLLEGLECLHSHDYVHRDLKPSNVMVTHEGRVVILDFGIIAEHNELDRGVTRDGQVLGTPAYMAPEQASGDRAGTPSDLYSLGVMLYECLTGEPPFTGPALRMLSEKQDGPTPDPGLVVDELPPRIRDLCLRLMHRDPSRRPSAREVLAELGGQSLPRVRRAASSLVGRQAELARLRRALAELREHRRAQTVQVRGRSGYGKSALVREFIAEAQREGELVVLRGRCRERETLPYKGVDAVVDALGVHLRQLDDEVLLGLQPRYVAALSQVFPVLDELWRVDERPGRDPHEARSLGWAALRELLTLLGERQPLLVAIDDFQWADLDSAAILRALTRGPDAPAMVLLISARDELADPELLDWIDDDERELVRIELGPLPEAEARELALALLRDRMDPATPSEPGPLRSRAEALALRSGGSPFFIAQMVLGGDAVASVVDIDQVVQRRLEALAPAARRLLEVVAVAGGPLARDLALALSPGANAEHVDALCSSSMLVRSEGETRPAIEVAHDRIRELTLAGIESEAARAMHWAIGEQLLAHGSEPEGDDVFAIADHLEAGLGEVDDLAADKRLELAELQRRAGERALAAAAWISARRYFALGHRLVEPWLAEARRGEGPRALCLAIASGRVQAEAMAKSAQADAAFEELLGWSLSAVELGQIVAQRVAILRCTDRMGEAIEVGHVGLARLGWRLPRHPTMIRAMLAMLLGWQTLGRLDVGALRALPEIDDERVRIRLDVLSEVAVSVFLNDPSSAFLIAGTVARAIHRHGRHESMVSVLVLLAVIICLLGKANEASDLCERALEYSESHASAPLDTLRARVLSFLVLPTTRPVIELADQVEALHRECCDCDLQESAGFLAVLGVSLYLMTDMRLTDVSEAIDRFEARNPGLSTFSEQLLALQRRYVHGLIAGDSWEPETINNVMVRYSDLSYRRGLAVQSGDYLRARELDEQFPADYQRVMMGSIAIPNSAMFGAIIEAQRWPLEGAIERQRSRWVLRRHAKTARRWAARGPANFGPIADIVEGELATTQGRFEQAMAAYERARVNATANRAPHLVGLACMRLARLAHRRGHAMMAESAFAAGIDTYEGWGAKALVTGLRERGLDGL
ncbi:protein kinase domain-containing protein [Nannocystaceae bacterium ST9]